MEKHQLQQESSSYVFLQPHLTTTAQAVLDGQGTANLTTEAAAVIGRSVREPITTTTATILRWPPTTTFTTGLNSYLKDKNYKKEDNNLNGDINQPLKIFAVQPSHISVVLKATFSASCLLLCFN